MLTMNFSLPQTLPFLLIGGILPIPPNNPISKFFKKRKKRMIKSSPFFNYEIFMRPGALDAIMKAKGYKSYIELAEALLVTKQYLSNVKSGRVGVSHTMIVRIAVLLNNHAGKWWSFYEIRPSFRRKNMNGTTYNMEKYEGQIPYVKNSPSGHAREKDGEVEFQKE